MAFAFQVTVQDKGLMDMDNSVVIAGGGACNRDKW